MLLVYDAMGWQSAGQSALAWATQQAACLGLKDLGCSQGQDCSVWSSLIPLNTLILSFFPSRGVRSEVHVMGTKSIVCALLTVAQGHPLPSPTLSKTQRKQGRCQSQGQSQGSTVPAQLWLLASPFKFSLGEWEVGTHFYFWSASCRLWFFRSCPVQVESHFHCPPQGQLLLFL